MESHTVPELAPPEAPSVLPQTISSLTETAAEHDEDYYFDDEPVVFKAEYLVYASKFGLAHPLDRSNIACSRYTATF